MDCRTYSQNCDITKTHCHLLPTLGQLCISHVFSATSHYLHSSTCSETDSFLLKPTTNLAHLPSDRHANVMSSHVKPLCSILSYSSLLKVKTSYGFTMHNVPLLPLCPCVLVPAPMSVPLQHHQPQTPQARTCLRALRLLFSVLNPLLDLVTCVPFVWLVGFLQVFAERPPQ